MEQMRISSYSGGLTLYEVMIRISAVGIISGLITVSMLPLIDRSKFVNTADQFKDTLRQAKWLALTKRKSHRINSDSGFLMFQKKCAGSYQTVSQEKNIGRNFSLCKPLAFIQCIRVRIRSLCRYQK